MPLSTPAIWRYIWKFSLEKKRKKWKQFDFAVVKSSNLIWEEVLIQEKNYSNATNMSMHLFTQAIWVDIWKLTLVIQVQPLWVYNLTIWDIETKIYKTDTETFLDQIFLERDWDFFCLKKFRDRLWGFIFNQNFRDQNFQYPYQYSQKNGKSLDNEKSRDMMSHSGAIDCCHHISLQRYYQSSANLLCSYNLLRSSILRL